MWGLLHINTDWNLFINTIYVDFITILSARFELILKRNDKANYDREKEQMEFCFTKYFVDDYCGFESNQCKW